MRVIESWRFELAEPAYWENGMSTAQASSII